MKRPEKEPAYKVTVWYAEEGGTWEEATTWVSARTIWSAAKKGLAKLQPVGRKLVAVKTEVRLARLEDSEWWKSRA